MDQHYFNNTLIAVFTSLAWLIGLCVALGKYHRARKYRQMVGWYFLGGIISTVLVMINLNTPLTDGIISAVGAEGFAYSFFHTGLIEEGSKLLVFTLLLRLMNPFDEPAVPLALALALGLGFNFFENFSCYLWVDSPTMFERGIGNDHGLLVSFSALAWVFMKYPGLVGKKELPVWAMPAGFLTAVLFHATHNEISGIEGIRQFVTILEWLVMAVMLAEISRASPSRNWTIQGRRIAVARLESAVQACPESGRNRVRLALYLLAGNNQEEAREALKILRGLSPRHRETRLLKVVEHLAVWQASVREAAKAAALENLALTLMYSPRTGKNYQGQLKKETGTKLWKQGFESRGRQVAITGGNHQPKGWQTALAKTLEEELQVLMKRTGVALKACHLARPDFRELDHAPLPPALKAEETRQRCLAAFQEHENRQKRLAKPEPHTLYQPAL